MAVLVVAWVRFLRSPRGPRGKSRRGRRSADLNRRWRGIPQFDVCRTMIGPSFVRLALRWAFAMSLAGRSGTLGCELRAPKCERERFASIALPLAGNRLALDCLGPSKRQMLSHCAGARVVCPSASLSLSDLCACVAPSARGCGRRFTPLSSSCACFWVNMSDCPL